MSHSMQAQSDRVPRGAEGLFFDYAATTPVREEVVQAMASAMADYWGNPSSSHPIGSDAKQKLNEAREQVAALLGASLQEIVFTSGGTEADNLAVISGVLTNSEKGKHIITSLAEHHAVLDACGYLETQGYSITYLKPDSYGRIETQDVLNAVKQETCFISLMHGNNELGTLNPIEEICSELKGSGIRIHTDAVQSVGKIPFTVNQLGVDYLSLSSHKLYGPKGAGALFVREGIPLMQRQWGGNQERRIRPGTENVPGIIGLGTACKWIQHEMLDERIRLLELRKQLLAGLESLKADWRCNTHPIHHLPHILSLSFDNQDGHPLIDKLSELGIHVSAGSACDAGGVKKSHVLEAISLPDNYAMDTIRFSMGKWTTSEKVDSFLKLLASAIHP